MASKPVKHVLKAYKQALEDVQKEIALIVQKYEVEGVLNISSKQRYTVLKSLEKQLVAQAQQLGEVNISKTKELLTDIYSESYYKTAYIIDKGITTNIDFAILRPEMIKAAINTPIDKQTFSKRIWKNQQKLVDRVYHDVSRALVQGKSTEKLARQIKKDFGVSAYEASRLINTETAKAISMAQDDIYNQSNTISLIMWDATLEANTCDICGSLDGQYYPKNNHPYLPQHPQCRCCLIPVVNGWQPKQKRDNETGEIIPYQTFAEWKKSKGI